MGKQFVKDLKIGNYVQSQFFVVDVSEQPFSSPNRSGETFLKVMLADISGTIKGIIWDRSIMHEPIYTDDVLNISGEVKDYYGPQLNINCYEKVGRDKINRSYFQQVSERDPEVMWLELQNITAATVRDTHLSALLDLFYIDRGLVERFKLSPAARIIHHSYLGGLLEHTLEVIATCRHAAVLYPRQLNESLLITGAIFHDMGKIEEYNMDSLSFQQTDRGRLLGHIAIGLEILRGKIAALPAFPQGLKMELEHMLLSHHGEKEWGSPEIPQTFAAFTLFHADLLSARLKQFEQVMSRGGAVDGAWTKRDRFLQRSIFTGGDMDKTL
ncbi:MAG: HD domain-containing protein [Bacillota bacterium]